MENKECVKNLNFIIKELEKDEEQFAFDHDVPFNSVSEVYAMKVGYTIAYLRRFVRMCEFEEAHKNVSSYVVYFFVK